MPKSFFTCGKAFGELLNKTDLLCLTGLYWLEGGGRFSVGALRRVTNLVPCPIPFPSFLGSTGFLLLNGFLVVPPLPWGYYVACTFPGIVSAFGCLFLAGLLCLGPSRDCGEDAELVSSVRSWPCCVQDLLWDARFSGRSPESVHFLSVSLPTLGFSNPRLGHCMEMTKDFTLVECVTKDKSGMVS